MNDLEPSGLIGPNTRDLADITGSTLLGHIDDGDIRDLEDGDRERELLVLSDRLEETREERGPDDLVLDRLGVGERDGIVAWILAVEPGKVLVMRAL